LGRQEILALKLIITCAVGQIIALKIMLKFPNIVLEDVIRSLGGVCVFLQVVTDILEGPAAFIFRV
jgi:esterase/lipase superfamily enzyme